MKGICPTCNKEFSSHFKKKYCCHECYTSSLEFKDRCNKLKKEKIAYICLNCGKTFYRLPGYKWTKHCSRECYYTAGSRPDTRVEKIDCICLFCKKVYQLRPGQLLDHGRKRKFCSITCWRRFFVERFDRFVASRVEIPLVQNFDEFLTQEKLPCLFPGCTWEGRHLAIHMSHAHGIKAEEVKELAGFNRHTPLMVPELIELLSTLQKKISQISKNGTKFKKGKDNAFPRGEKRAEAKEHQSKAMKLHYDS